jgi:hypothetical protein
MHPQFQPVKKTWWWIESTKSFRRLTENPFAQGYEVLRRIESFRTQLPASFCPPDQTWKQLYRRQKDYFSLNFMETLRRLNLIKGIFAGPQGISFDATQSSDYLLKALQYELSNPTPLACGTQPLKNYGFRIVPKRKPDPKYKEFYTKRPIDKPLWEKGPVETGVYLPLPQYTICGEVYEATSDEIYAYFRNFIKDNPPADFSAYRRTVRRTTKTGRQERAETIALGLMAFDYSILSGTELKDLADWLFKTFRRKKIPDFDDVQLSKALYHARSRIFQVFEAACKLR